MEPIEKLGVATTSGAIILGICFQNLCVIAGAGVLLLAIIFAAYRR